MKKKCTVSWIMMLLFIATNFTVFGQKQQLQKPISESVSFPIMTWYGLTAEQLDIAHFRELADAGFTINFSHFGTYELNKKALDLAEQVGVKLLIMDDRIQLGKPIDKAALEKIDQVVRDYKDHPAFYGYHIIDEPTASTFENMAAIKKEILLKDSSHMIYANLLPNYANAGQLGTRTYPEYVDKYIQVFKPQFISWDFYPFTNEGFRDGYYENMEVVRAASLKAGLPFWAFTMSCQIYPPYPEPKESWIRLQLYSDLAYGAKGLQYFTYSLPHSSGEDFKIAILDGNGKPTHLYNTAKQVNSEIHSLEPTLKKLSSIGVYHTEPLPRGTKSLPENFYIKKATGGPMVVGYLKDKSKRPYLLLVNRDYDKELNSTLSVSEKVKGLAEVSKSGEKVQTIFKVQNGKIKIPFDKGDGRLFRVIL